MSDPIQSRAPLSVRLIANLPPWSLLSIPVTGFPVPPEELAPLRPFCEALHGVLSRRKNAREICMQAWKIGPGSGSEVLAEYANAWQPLRGLGIWPNRDPPRTWTQEDISDAAASLFDGSEMVLPAHRVFRLLCSEAQREAAFANLFGSGTLLQLYTPDFKRVVEQARDLFLPTIAQRRFRQANFYLPLLDIETMLAAKDLAQLETWLCGVGAYVRESGEDKSILVLAPQLEAAVEEAAQEAGTILQLVQPDGTVKAIPSGQQERAVTSSPLLSRPS